MPAKKEISLLPDVENANSLVNRALKWVTTVGRVIIIVTELIVISAFVSRFWLDRKNSDLDDTIRQQKAILETTQDFEAEYNLLAARLQAIQNNDTTDSHLDSQLIDLTTSIPNEIYMESMSVDTKDGQVSLKMSAVAYEESAIVDFITNLTLNPTIKSVDVQRIEKKSRDSRYLITLVIVLNAKEVSQ